MLSVRAPVDGPTNTGAATSQKQSAKAVAEKPGGGDSVRIVHVWPPSPVVKKNGLPPMQRAVTQPVTKLSNVGPCFPQRGGMALGAVGLSGSLFITTRQCCPPSRVTEIRMPWSVHWLVHWPVVVNHPWSESSIWSWPGS